MRSVDTFVGPVSLHWFYESLRMRKRAEPLCSKHHQKDHIESKREDAKRLRVSKCIHHAPWGTATYKQSNDQAA